MEQQAAELLIRARADVFTVCKGRKPNSCYHEKRDELKALETYYAAECSGLGSNALRIQGTVLFEFCDQLADLFDDNTDDIDENVVVFDIVESARRRYAMICASYLSPLRCHDELAHELEQAEEAFEDYCDDLIVAKTFLTSENNEAAAKQKASDARHECKMRVSNVFDRHWQIAALGAGDAAMAPNGAVPASQLLAGGDDATYDLFNRRVIAWTAQLEVHQLCGHIPLSACATHPSTMSAYNAAKAKFNAWCGEQAGTSAGPATGPTRPTVAVAFNSAGALRNNRYFGFNEVALCRDDVEKIFNGALDDAADVPFFAFYEHVSDLLTAARGVYAQKCGALDAHDCKEFYGDIEENLHGNDARDTDVLSDVKHAFRDACESLPYFIVNPAAAAPVAVDTNRTAAREHACKSAVDDIFNGSDDDDDDTPASFEELFTNARLRYATICNGVTPFSAAACYAAHRPELHTALSIAKDQCDDLTDDDDDSSSSSSSSSSSDSSSSSSSDDRKRNVKSSSTSLGDDDDDDFRDGCHKIVTRIFDDQDDARVAEKLSLLTVEEIHNWARYRYNILCGIRDDCSNKDDLRDEKKRLYHKCEQSHLTAQQTLDCKVGVHSIFDDEKETRGQYRATIMQVARYFYYEVCGWPNGWNTQSLPVRTTCYADAPTVGPQLKRARDHIIHRLCNNLNYKPDESQCDAAVYQVFDNQPDLQVNGFNPVVSAGTGTASSDLVEFEDYSVAIRQWANRKQDIVCDAANPTQLPGTMNNLVHVCKRSSTSAYGRLLAIGIAKCTKLLNDFARNECVSAIKNIYDNQNDSGEDGGRYVQDFAIVRPAFNAYYNA